MYTEDFTQFSAPYMPMFPMFGNANCLINTISICTRTMCEQMNLLSGRKNTGVDSCGAMPGSRVVNLKRRTYDSITQVAQELSEIRTWLHKFRQLRKEQV